MTAMRVRRFRLIVWFVWGSLAALLLSSVVPSFSGAAAADPTPPGPSLAVAVSGGGPLSAEPSDPPSSVPTVVASVDVGTEPLAGATDLADGFVYVANGVSNNVSVLNGTAVAATVALPSGLGDPLYVAYDGLNGYVYVVVHYDFESSGGAVCVLNGTTLLATIAVGKLPDSAVVDPSTGYVYVPNSGGTAVSVIEGTSLLASVTVGSGPTAAAYDPLDGYVYVANEGSSNVSVLSGTTVVDSLPVGNGPDAVAYDPLDGYVYVANNVSNNATILDGIAVVGSVGVGADPSFIAFAPAAGGVEVANTNSSNVTVINGTASVAPVAVAAGPVWVGPGPFGPFSFAVGSLANEVTILEGTTSLGSVPVGSLPIYGIADPTNLGMYIVNSGSNNVSVFAAGYSVLFNETGLAPGTTWSVTLGALTNSSNTSSVGFLEPAGSYAYSIASPAGYTLVSSVPPSPLTVTNRSVVVNVTFVLVPTTTYTLTFTETGLGKCHALGGAWGSQGSGGCCRSSSLSWSVTVNGVTKATTNTSLSFSEPSGTYDYTVDAPSGYVVTSSVPPSPVTISSANVTVAVTFARSISTHPLSLVFVESGLPWGTVWCVTVNVTQCSSEKAIIFSGLSPGTYAFNVSAVPGYTAHPENGSVPLSYRSETVYVRFSPTGHHHVSC